MKERLGKAQKNSWEIEFSSRKEARTQSRGAGRDERRRRLMAIEVSSTKDCTEKLFSSSSLLGAGVRIQ